MCLYCDINKSSGKLTAIYLHQNACLYFKRSNRMLSTIKQKISKYTKKENKLFNLFIISMGINYSHTTSKPSGFLRPLSRPAWVCLVERGVLGVHSNLEAKLPVYKNFKRE